MKHKSYFEFNDAKDRIKIQVELLSRVSKESKSQIKMHPRYDAILLAANDPLALVQIIIATHSTNNSGIPTEDKRQAREQFNRLKQGNMSLVIDFKERFEDCLRVLTNIGGEVPPKDILVVEFLHKMDTNRFGQFGVDRLNCKEMLATWQETFAEQAQYQVLKPLSRAGAAPTFTAAMFLTSAESSHGRRDSRGGESKGNHDKADHHHSGDSKSASNFKKKSKTVDQSNHRCNACNELVTGQVIVRSSGSS
jgi:hypothetical protein